jgi:DNA-binding protein H-NS
MGMMTFPEINMAKPSLANMSVESLLQLRTDVTVALRRKAKELTRQLSRLGEEIGPKRKQWGSSLKGRKVPAKYRDRSGNTWAGRGAVPVWLREKIKAGAKLQDFAVDTKIASQREPKKRRRAKR